MPQKSIRQALNEALAQEMRRDPRVVVIGEDVAGGAGTDGQRDAYGGVLGVTKGLFAEFGEGRVIGRLVVVDEATPRCNMAADIAALAVEKAFAALKASVKRVTAPHTPVPFAPSLEKLYIPSPERIADGVCEVYGYGP